MAQRSDVTQPPVLLQRFVAGYADRWPASVA